MEPDRHKFPPVIDVVFLTVEIEAAAAMVVAVGFFPQRSKIPPQQVAHAVGMRVNAEAEPLLLHERMAGHVEAQLQVHARHERLRAFLSAGIAAGGELVPEQVHQLRTLGPVAHPGLPGVLHGAGGVLFGHVQGDGNLCPVHRLHRGGKRKALRSAAGEGLGGQGAQVDAADSRRW